MAIKVSTRIAAMIIIFCCMQINSALAETPRLFMARKGERVAFFLPLSHLTSSAERDAYLLTVIEPIFRRVAIVYEEAVPLSHIYPFALHPCTDAVPILPTVQARLDKRYKFIKKYDNYHFPLDVELVEHNFAKIMVAFLGPVSYNRNDLPPNFVWHPGQISRVLAEKYGIQIESIDSMNDFHEAYCQLGNTEEKSNEVSSILDDAESKTKYTDLVASNNYKLILAEATKTLYEDSTYKNTKDKRFSLVAEKFLLSARNKIWIKKIVQNTKKNSVAFYGLGAAHFLNNKYDQGLFGLLKREGFEISLIYSLKDVPTNILEIFPSEQIDRSK